MPWTDDRWGIVATVPTPKETPWANGGNVDAWATSTPVDFAWDDDNNTDTGDVSPSRPNPAPPLKSSPISRKSGKNDTGLSKLDF